MDIALPTEIKTAEKRVALTPDACRKLIQAGHKVTVQAGAGIGAGFHDDLYLEAGCHLASTAKATYQAGELIVKVKEPLPDDLKYLKPHQTLFCYLHLAADSVLTEHLQHIGLRAIAFETIKDTDGHTPLLAPMSQVAGRLSIQLACHFLQAAHGGRGTLLGGISSMADGRVLVIGAGEAGREAAHAAYHLGAKVTVLDINQQKLNKLKAAYPRMQTLQNTPETLAELLPHIDVLIGAVYVVGKKAPHVVTEAHIAQLPKGAVVVDISIDQGGCIATSKPCTHTEPSFVHNGIVHSAITNLPGAVPRTATIALSKAILPYVQDLAAGKMTPLLESGINVIDGKLCLELD